MGGYKIRLLYFSVEKQSKILKTNRINKHRIQIKKIAYLWGK
jgi:hypothetical protein